MTDTDYVKKIKNTYSYKLFKYVPLYLFCIIIHIINISIYNSLKLAIRIKIKGFTDKHDYKTYKNYFNETMNYRYFIFLLIAIFINYILITSEQTTYIYIITILIIIPIKKILVSEYIVNKIGFKIL